MRSLALTVLLAIALLPGGNLLRADVLKRTMNHAYVVDLAIDLAKEPYREKKSRLPRFLRELTYDDYRRIRFLPEQALWEADPSPFKVHFFHPGFIHERGVRIHEFTDDFTQRIPFVRAFFDYQDLRVPGRLPGDLDYAGFKVLYALNTPDRMDEVISFLGASYYRALGRTHRYGISARGLALNSGGPETEEFPSFVEFWLGKPGADAHEIVIHALLDSPSVAGAYTFKVVPGDETVMEVQATLVFRQTVAIIGLAPMTSMFWYGENSPSRHGDFRPEVHDSDGLLVATDAQSRVWRPLMNPHEVTRTDIPAPALGGFGVLQRDRLFSSYEDMEAAYQHRPGLWMEPIGSWPAGRVRLVELPTPDEYHDNIVAFWIPEVSPAAGEPMELAYRLRWTSASFYAGPSGYVSDVRQEVKQAGEGRTLYVIDFSPNGLERFPPGAEVVPQVEVPGSVVIEHMSAQHNDVDGSWRLAIRLLANDRSQPVEIRARLMLGGEPITETVQLRWNP